MPGSRSGSQPLSLAEAKRLAETADTVLLRATRPADLDTPIGAFLAMDDGTPAYLLESVEGGERLGRYSFLGTLPRRLLEVRDGTAHVRSRPVGSEVAGVRLSDTAPSSHPVSDPLTALRSFLPRRRVAPVGDMPRFTGGAVGVLAYDAVSAFEPTVPLPRRDPVGVPMAAFLETDLVLVFDHLTHTLSAIASLHTDAPDFEGRYTIAERAIHEALERTAGAPMRSNGDGRSPAGMGVQRSANALSAHDLGDVRPATEASPPTSLDAGAYLAAVETAKEAIRAGECIQVVVGRRRSVPIPDTGHGALTGIELYRALRRVSPSPYLFYIRLPDFELVGASPELLLQVQGDRMVTHPIAGTTPRGATPEEDRELAARLAADRKERAEHVMLVDLARNDLGRVATPGSVAVTRYLQVERFSHVQHLVSHVEGRLRPGADALDALRAVFPAGTLSGAPKVRAMQLIAQLEGERRGLYGGAVGYLGYDGSLDTAITIRSAVLRDGIAHIHAGAGIVAGSVPDRELAETEHKSSAMVRALESAAPGAGIQLGPEHPSSEPALASSAGGTA